MGSHVVRFHCPVCGGQYSTVQDWLAHFLEDPHQNLSREGLINANGSWNGDEKKRALVVLSNQPVVKEGQSRILQYFSKNFYEAVVTDFVWWTERPRVGFLQFDTSEMAKKAMTVQNQRIHVEDQEFRLKEAVAIVDLEWDALLPTSTETRGVQDPSRSNGNPKRKIKVEKMDDEEDGSESEVNNPTEDAQQRKRKKRKLTSPNQPTDSSAEYLLRQLNLIQTSVKVPDDDYDSIQRLLPLLESLFVKHHTKHRLPIVITAFLSRNWFLKLKYNEEDPPFVFIQKMKIKPAPKPYKLLPTPMTEINSLLSHGEKAKTLFTSRTRVFPLGKNSVPKSEPFVIFSLSEGTGDPFPTIKITGNRERNVETKLWRIVKYLCTFDERCMPLLAVIYHWAGINSIQLAYSNSESGLANDRDLPDPFVITWLVILFLCKKKLLPAPAQILKRSRNQKKNPTMFLKGVNIAFYEDMEFLNSWVAKKPVMSKPSGSFAEVIFLLAAEFLLYWGRALEKGKWIIDAGSGSVFRMGSIRNGSFAAEGMPEVKRLLKKGDRLHLTNPFCYSWKINLSNSKEPYQAMITTGKKLEEFLLQLKNTGDEEGVGMGDQELLELFKI